MHDLWPSNATVRCMTYWKNSSKYIDKNVYSSPICHSSKLEISETSSTVGEMIVVYTLV